MDNHSHIDYTEYHDESEEPSLYLSVSDTQDKQSFKSIDLSEKLESDGIRKGLGNYF